MGVPRAVWCCAIDALCHSRSDREAKSVVKVHCTGIGGGDIGADDDWLVCHTADEMQDKPCSNARLLKCWKDAEGEDLDGLGMDCARDKGQGAIVCVASNKAATTSQDKQLGEEGGWVSYGQRCGLRRQQHWAELKGTHMESTHCRDVAGSTRADMHATPRHWSHRAYIQPRLTGCPTEIGACEFGQCRCARSGQCALHPI